MSDMNAFLKRVPGDEQIGFSRPESPLPEPLEVIRLSLASVDAAHERFPGYRLTRLVAARLELKQTLVDFRMSSTSIFFGRSPA